jgi:hypothetical protein
MLKRASLSETASSSAVKCLYYSTFATITN